MAEQQQQRGEVPPRGARPSGQTARRDYGSEPWKNPEAVAEKREEFRLLINDPRFDLYLREKMPPEHRKDRELVTRVKDSMIRAVKDNAQLLWCNWDSFRRAAEEACRRGLWFGDNMAWAVPYSGVVQFQLGWRGMVTLSKRSGEVTKVITQVVHEADQFRCTLGNDPHVEHAVDFGDRGEWIGVYAIAHYRDGGCDVELMSRGEVQRLRDLSPSKNSPAWKNHETEMGRAKVTKRLAKRLPLQDPQLLIDDDDVTTIDGSAEEVERKVAALEDKREVPFEGPRQRETAQEPRRTDDAPRRSRARQAPAQNVDRGPPAQDDGPREDPSNYARDDDGQAEAIDPDSEVRGPDYAPDDDEATAQSQMEDLYTKA